MPQLFANNADSTLAAPVSSVALSIQVASGEGVKFPTPTGGDYFLATLCKVVSGVETTIEIIKVTARATDILTIVRAQEGTTAQTYTTSDRVSLRMTAAFPTRTVTTDDAQTISGTKVLSSVKSEGFVFVDKGNSGTATQTLDFSAGMHQKITATGNHTIASSNWPASGSLGEMLLELVNGGAYTVTWPTINWVRPDGTVTTSIATYLTALGRTLQSSGTDFAVLWSRDAGTTIYGKLL
jgi:hypothetical protein